MQHYHYPYPALLIPRNINWLGEGCAGVCTCGWLLLVHRGMKVTFFKWVSEEDYYGIKPGWWTTK